MGFGPICVSCWHTRVNPTSDPLQSQWRTLNIRYFHGALAPIRIEWSRRLTSSAGLFISLDGPRSPRALSGLPGGGRLIRLSIPLLQRADGQPDHILLSTLAHEMIHQWQFDVLKRRPNHGPDFCRKMTELNRDGLGITIRHRMYGPVRALARYAWRCLRCGRAYERQRRTIHPGRHRCGACHGPLGECGLRVPTPIQTPSVSEATAGLRGRLTRMNRGIRVALPTQLPLPFGGTS